MTMSGHLLDYVSVTEARAHSRLALVSLLCWALVVLGILTHVLITETTTGYPPRFPNLTGLEPAVRTPLVLGELVLWVVGIVTGVWGTLRRGRRRRLAVLGLTLCVLTAPATCLLILFRYAPLD
jgi:hypothetical protein